MREMGEAAADWLVGRLEEMEGALAALVEVNSWTENPEGGRKVGALLREHFAMPGLAAEVVASTRYADHLVFRSGGAPGRAPVALVGHLDTVFPPGKFEGYRRDGALRRGEGSRIELTKGGVTVVLRVLGLHPGGRHDGAVVLLRDVTELKRRDRALISKDATSREVHHRVKNNLQVVSSLVLLKARQSPDEATRRVLLLDGGPPRNAKAQAAHGVLTRDGILPTQLKTIGLEDLGPYDVTVVQSPAREVRVLEGVGFAIRHDGVAGGWSTAPRLLFATGVRDLLPAVQCAVRWPAARDLRRTVLASGRVFGPGVFARVEAAHARLYPDAPPLRLCRGGNVRYRVRTRFGPIRSERRTL